MRIRRCRYVFLEPREQVSFDLHSILSGGPGMERTLRWVALAPHLGQEVELSAAEVDLLGRLSPESWIEIEAIDLASRRLVDRLLVAGLVVGEDYGHEHASHDARIRAVHWHGLSATYHAFTRWHAVDSVSDMQVAGTDSASGLRTRLGKPPAFGRIGAGPARFVLPRVEPTSFDDLLARRATCRNFDASRKVPFDTFAQVLQRVFAAQAEVRVTDDTVFLKKNVPSGGGLHPMECYLIVQHVEGIEPGLYHYQAQEHALEPLPGPDRPLREFVMDMVAQQHWFADAHVVVLLSPRFDRTFWKYRHHAKGYRVIALEGGHLSQTLYLAATDAGLGAFITGAINEVELEQAFGLDPIHQGALAICGFGWRGPVMETAELDPAERVWVRAEG